MEKKENTDVKLALTLTKCLENTYCAIFFDNFFNSLSPTVMFFDKGVYTVGTARKNKKDISEITVDKKRRSLAFVYRKSGFL